MKATYRISEDDYVNAMKLFAKFTLRKAVTFWGYVLVWAAIVAFGPPTVSAAAEGGLIGLVIVLAPLRYVISPIVARRNYRKYKAIQQEFAVEILDDGVRFMSPNSDGKLTWANMLKWRHNENYILIYPMPRLYHILPKSIASGGFDVALLINRLTEHVGKPA